MVQKLWYYSRLAWSDPGPKIGKVEWYSIRLCNNRPKNVIID